MYVHMFVHVCVLRNNIACVQSVMKLNWLQIHTLLEYSECEGDTYRLYVRVCVVGRQIRLISVRCRRKVLLQNFQSSPVGKVCLEACFWMCECVCISDMLLHVVVNIKFSSCFNISFPWRLCLRHWVTLCFRPPGLPTGSKVLCVCVCALSYVSVFNLHVCLSVCVCVCLG